MSNCPWFGLHMKMRQIYYLPFLVFSISDQKYGLHHRGGAEGAYIHVHHFHEIEMLHTMKATCLEVACVLNCFIGSPMQISWPFLALCNYSIGCVKKLL
jgi:hypothetical protein